jgi:hypothetical protein
MSLTKPISESYWVKPGFFLAGEYPGHYDEFIARQRLSAFLKAGFADFIDLTYPTELESYEWILKEVAQSNDIETAYNRISIQDRGIPVYATMKHILDLIDANLERSRKIYVHCWGGVGRTGTVVGCYLVRHGLSGDQALRQIADWWMDVPKHIYNPTSPETVEQSEFIRTWRDSPLSQGEGDQW